jgi:hypothetical protein
MLLLASFLLAFLDSCGMGRWRRYKYRGHYVHRKKYRPMHQRHNRDW